MPNPFAAAVALQDRPRASYAGAATSRLFADWAAGILSPHREIQYNLRTLRARARDLVRNNSYAAGFETAVADNVVGWEGIQLRAKLMDAGDRPRRQVNWAIERGWEEWGHPENASVDGRDSWVDLQRLVVKTIATDGEVFVRGRLGFSNPFGYSLQLIDADLLDETYDRAPDNRGVEIRMGVELNADGRPLAYHFFKNHPADRWGLSRERVRIPADEIIHLFVRYRPGQVRGVTWFAPVLADVKMLDGLTEAELVAARTAAAKMGFITNNTPEAIDAYAARLASGQAQQSKAMDAAPGVIDELMPGQVFQEWDPTHPSSAFEAFVKTILRGIARGLGVSYLTLTGDVAEANYSSMRAGLIPERDGWRCLQHWYATHLHRPVYRAWLPMALLTGALRLPTRTPSDYHAVAWEPRGWQWVDPAKDLEAAEREVHLGINSRQRLASERGRGDWEEIVDDLAEEQAYADAKGVWIGGAGGTERIESISRQEDDGARPKRAAKPAALLPAHTNGNGRLATNGNGKR